MISLIDILSRNNSHFFFNYSILNEIKKKVNYCCLENNEDIIDKCKKENIEIKQVKVSAYYTLTTVTAFLKVVLNNPSKNIVILAIDNLIMPLLFVVFFPFMKKKKYSIILHNNYLTLKNNSLKRVLFKFFVFLYKPKLIVLSPFLKEEYEKEVFCNLSIKSVFHQNYSNFLEPTFSKNKNIIISSPSSHSKIIFQSTFLNHIDFNIVKESRIKFRFVKQNENNRLFNNYIEYSKRPENSEKYYSFIKAADYIFFPLSKEANYRASGVLMDALTVGVNFIGPNVGHFKDIYKEFGLGILYDKYEDLNNILPKLENKRIEITNRFLKETNVKKLINLFYE